MAKFLRKFAYWILGFFLLLLLLGFGAQYWVDAKLPALINEKNNSKYYITYKDIDISLISATIKANEIVIVPKSALKSEEKAGLYAKIESVEVQQFSVWNILFSDKITARKIAIKKPELLLYKKDSVKTAYSKGLRNQVVEPFGQLIGVSEVELSQGKFQMLNAKTQKLQLEVQQIYFKLEGIVINDEVLAKKIPFSFKTYAFKCDSLFYKPNVFYSVHAQHLETNNSGFSISDFRYKSDLSRTKFLQLLQTERDIYNIAVQEIKLNDLKWGFDNSDAFFLRSGLVELNKPDAVIYRNKLVADDFRKKKLYNRLLRDLKFDLDIDTLKVKSAHLVYEEQISEVGPGKLEFANMNLSVLNLRSAFKRKKMPDVDIAIQTQFMGAPLHVNWTFNVLDETDGFHIKGRIKNLNAQRMLPFAKPYVNIAAEGIFEEVNFDFRGNDNLSKGLVALEYDDLKYTIFRKKDREKKNKFLTAVAGLLVKKDTKEKVKSAQIEVEREKHKSFFNLLWKSLAEGLKKILI